MGYQDGVRVAFGLGAKRAHVHDRVRGGVLGQLAVSYRLQASPLPIFLQSPEQPVLVAPHLQSLQSSLTLSLLGVVGRCYFRRISPVPPLRYAGI